MDQLVQDVGVASSFWNARMVSLFALLETDFEGVGRREEIEA